MANERTEMQQQARMLAPRLFDAFNAGAESAFDDVSTIGWNELSETTQAGWEGVALFVLRREATLREAAAQAARELETLGMKYTVAHPENTMRVLELLWKDEHRIAGDLRKAVDGDRS